MRRTSIGKLGHRAAWTLALCAAASAPGWAGQRGKASWYGRWHEGRPMANHQPFHRAASTVAHRTLPLGTVVEITNLRNGRVAEAEVTDRGPYVRGRVVDVSRAVAEELGMVEAGTAQVEIRIVDPQLVAEGDGPG